MAGQPDLAKRVPTPGLSCTDWKAVGKPLHVTRVEKERDATGVRKRVRLGVLWEGGRKGGEVEDKNADDGGQTEVPYVHF